MYNFLLPSLIASIGWGISPFFEKKVILNTDPQTALVYKGIISGIFGIILFLTNVKNFTKIKNISVDINLLEEKRKVPLIIFSLIGVFLSYWVGNLAYLIALNNNNGPVMLVPLIAYVFPLFVMTIISYFIMKEKINCNMIIGIIITIIGICFTIYNKPN